MTPRFLSALLFALTLSTIAVAQDAKPASKPAPKPVELTVAGRKTTIAPGEGWQEFKPEAAPELPKDAAPWKLAGAWKSRQSGELTLRVYGVEATGATATTVREAWFAGAKARGKRGIVVKTDIKNKKEPALTGHDLEVDVVVKEVTSYTWIRTINLAKDKVAVLFAEGRPLKGMEAEADLPFKFEPHVVEAHVMEIQPVLASFMNKGAKPEEGWTRGPKFEMSWGLASLTFMAPTGWEYTRLGPEGSVIWMSPGTSNREYVVAMDGTPEAAEMRLQIERMMVEASGGKVLQDKDLEGAAGGHEVISCMDLGDRPLWNWRRVYRRGAVTISVLAKVPVADVGSVPADGIQQAAKGFFDEVKIGK